ncbi:MAG: hypothetical protein AVDCRST_MAG93-3560 [uncultured Chloroflexia bacterium]|uniref:Uncharacterized protein n=1 Tax=uncultured Chloroflexia bacterium TaxID=1672391 RepID=A0A6J4JSA9_9CHLR|nr:MAG: hypothetical protein AVDCRST_MAG93-3560 [uncultured Chloroflexia bacterium]
MAYKLLREVKEASIRKAKRFHISMPKLTGKFSASIFLGGKELFLGIAVADVEVEQVVRKRIVKNKPGSVKVFQFD